MLQKLDDRLMDLAQRFSDWIHSLTGYDSIQQARFVRGFTALGWLLSIVRFQQNFGYFNWIAAVLLVVNVSFCFFETPMDDQIRSEGQRGFRNSRRVRFPNSRIAIVAITALFFFLPYEYVIINASTAVVIFLEACDVQTPRAGRIRESLRQFATRILLRPVPSMRSPVRPV